MGLPVLGELVHLAAAFAVGRALLRLPGASPRGALDLLVTATALGLAFLSACTLLAAAVGWTHGWVAWSVDALAFALGARGLREAVERVTEPWRHRELSVLVTSRVPLLLALSVAGLLYLLPPFMPAGASTGAPDLAVPLQAALRHDLTAALDALPGHHATPSLGLLLHGALTGGAAGARLHGLACLLLFGAAVWLHAERHLGSRAAGWAALCAASTPFLVRSTAASPGDDVILLFGFLAFHEVGDWLRKAAGGKIALVSIYGGLLIAESARGAAIFVSLLVFLLLVESLIDRQGIVRQVGGVSGMAGIALALALPLVALSLAVSHADPARALAARYLPARDAQDADATHLEASRSRPVRASSAASGASPAATPTGGRSGAALAMGSEGASSASGAVGPAAASSARNAVAPASGPPVRGATGDLGARAPVAAAAAAPPADGASALGREAADSALVVGEELMARAAHAAMALGPLLLGLTCLILVVASPPEPLRHALLAALLGAVVAVLPAPYATPLGIVGPAAVAAGGIAVALLAQRGAGGLAAGLFLAAAVPTTLALAVARGPDLAAGLALLTGRLAPEAYLQRQIPDAALVDAASRHRLPDDKVLLLVGDLTDAQHAQPVMRLDPDLAPAEVLALVTDPRGAVGAVALDRASAQPDMADALAHLATIEGVGADGRFVLLAPRLREPPR